MDAKRKIAYLALMGNTILWGISPVIIKLGLSEIPPFTFLLYRFLIAVGISTPIMILFRKRLLPASSDIPRLLLVGFLGGTATLGLLFFGINLTSSIEASLLAALSPLTITLLGVLLLKEKLTRNESIGTIITFAGAILIAATPMKNAAGLTLGIFGNTLILLSNLVWAISVILMKKLAAKYHAFTIVYFSFLISLVTLFPLAYLENPDGIISLANNPLNFSLASLSISYMAVFGSIIAFFLYQLGQSYIEASEASLFTYLQPLFATPLAIILLGERINIYFITGAIIVVIGVILAEYRSHAKHPS